MDVGGTIAFFRIELLPDGSLCYGQEVWLEESHVERSTGKVSYSIHGTILILEDGPKYLKYLQRGTAFYVGHTFFDGTTFITEHPRGIVNWHRLDESICSTPFPELEPVRADTIGFPALWGSWRSGQYESPSYCYVIAYIELRPDGSFCYQEELLQASPAVSWSLQRRAGYEPRFFYSDRIYSTGFYAVHGDTLTLTVVNGLSISRPGFSIFDGSSIVTYNPESQERIQWRRLGESICASLGEPKPGPEFPLPDTIEELVATLDINWSAFVGVGLDTLMKLWDLEFITPSHNIGTYGVCIEERYEPSHPRHWVCSRYEVITTYAYQTCRFTPDGWYSHRQHEGRYSRLSRKVAVIPESIIQGEVIASGDSFTVRLSSSTQRMSGKGRYEVHGDTLIFHDLFPRLIAVRGWEYYTYLYAPHKLRFGFSSLGMVFYDIDTGEQVNLWGEYKPDQLTQAFYLSFELVVISQVSSGFGVDHLTRLSS